MSFISWLSPTDKDREEAPETASTSASPDIMKLLEEQSKNTQLIASGMQQMAETLAALKVPQAPITTPQPVEEQLTEEELSAIADDPRKMMTMVKTLAAQEAERMFKAREATIRNMATDEASRVVNRESAQERFFAAHPDLRRHEKYIEYRLRDLNIPETVTGDARSAYIADAVRKDLNLTKPTHTPSSMARGYAGGGAIPTDDGDFVFDSEDFMGSVEKIINRNTAQMKRG